MMSECQNRIIRWFKSLSKGSPSTSHVNQATHMYQLINDTQLGFVLEERARVSIQMCEFDQAISLLEDLPATQSQQLLLAECYFESGRNAEALACVDHLQALVTSYPSLKASNLTELINDYITTSFNIRALILLRCESELHKINGSNDDDTLAAIEICSYKTFCLVDTMVEQGDRMRSIAEDFGPKFISEMLGKIRDFKGEGKAEKKMEYEARCLNNLGLCYRAIKNYHKSIKCFRNGVRIIKRRRSANASACNILGDLMRNMGLVLHDHGNYPAAESLYLQSLNAYGKAEKIQNEARKIADKESTIVMEEPGTHHQILQAK